MTETDQLEIITVDAQNIDSEHICCALGNDKKHQAAPTAFPSVSIFWQGEFETHIIQSHNAFRKLVMKLKER